MFYLGAPFLRLSHSHFAEQSQYVHPILIGIKEPKRLAIQAHHHIGFGGLHMRHSYWRGIDPVAHHNIARPDWDSPQCFPSLNAGQLEEIALQIR
jgi:hypothetical protein